MAIDRETAAAIGQVLSFFGTGQGTVSGTFNMSRENGRDAFFSSLQATADMANLLVPKLSAK